MAELLSDAHLREIGRIAVGFNGIEFILRWMVWQMLGVDQDVAGTSTLGDTFAPLAEKFKRLAAARLDPDQRKEALDWLRHARLAADARTTTVHATWTGSSDEGEALMLRLKKGEWWGDLVTPEKVRKLADGVNQVARNGVELAERLGLFNAPLGPREPQQ